MGFSFISEESGRLYAIVDNAESMGNGRIAIHLDGIGAEFFDKATKSDILKDGNQLALVRIVSTWNRLEDISKEGMPLKDGDWVEINIDKNSGGPMTWIMGLWEGENPVIERFRLTGIRRLSDEEAPRSVGAAAAIIGKPSKRLISAKFNLNTLRAKDNFIITMLLSGIERPTSIVVYDVGQASFISVLCDDDRIIYFDVGAPMWFNSKTLPKRFCPPFNDNSLIVLSHWDWDHFEYGRRHDEFHNLRWLAPTQIVGPNAFKFAKALYDAGNLFLVGNDKGRNSLNTPGPFTIYICSGSDRNCSGLAMDVEINGRIILLTGDCSLAHIPVQMPYALNGFSMPHHGSQDMGPVVPPTGITCGGHRPTTIVSYGEGNRYGHPHQGTLNNYINSGWSVIRTAQHNGQSRGDRRF